MRLVNLMSIVATVCILVASCQSATVPEDAVETRIQRVGSLNKYYLMTWQHVVSGTEMEEVANSAGAIGELSLTGSENVAIVVHGRESGAHSEFAYTLRNSLITADKTMAVILVDWSFVSFTQGVVLLPSVAEDLIAFIRQMVASGKLNRDLLHLIGFDLGAHVVGIASRNTNARARKITALSPAGGWGINSQRLRATDAQFVETIHTNAIGTGFGFNEAIGGLDFFVNGGARQPGCSNSDNWCHHNRAWQLFAATVDTRGHLFGMRCDSMTQVNNDRCVGLPRAVMGTLATSKLATGLYRVNTGGTYNYSA